MPVQYQTTKSPEWNILYALGDVIQDYFLNIVNEGEEFYLFVDGDLFNNFIAQTEYSRNDVVKALDAFKCNSTDPYICLCIIAYQVQMLYDIENFDENRFYELLQIYYPSLKNSTSIAEDYFGNSQLPLGEVPGEKIWKTAKDFFNKKKRYLIHREFKRGAGRFVGLTKSQNIFFDEKTGSGGSIKSHLLPYITVFNEIGLEPNAGGIGFDSFKSMILEFYDKNMSEYKYSRFLPDYQTLFTKKKIDIFIRMLFNFYNYWDGRSEDDYRNHKQKTEEETIPLKEVHIEYVPGTNVYRFLIDREQVTFEKIPEEYISKVNNKPFKFVRSSQMHTYWEAFQNGNMLEDDVFEYLLIFDNRDFNFNLSVFTNDLPYSQEGNAAILSVGDYRFVIIRNIDIPERRIFLLDKEKVKKTFDLFGGIKVSGYGNFAKTWQSFALPIVRCYDEKISKVQIDGKPYELEDSKNGEKIKVLQITEEMLRKDNNSIEGPTRHTVSVNNSTDIVFYVESKQRHKELDISNHGWMISRKKNPFVKVAQSDFFISGYTMNEIYSYRNPNRYRKFEEILRKDNQFDENSNKRIEEWCRYGR